MAVITRPSADKTRKKILKYALKLFSQKGYSATTVRDIAKAARVNLNLIFHHFKSKELLWKAIGDIISEKYVEMYLVEDLHSSDLKTVLHEYIFTRYNFYKDNPEIYRLIRWKNIEPNENISFTNSIYLKVFQPRLQELQAIGEIRKDVDLDIAALFISSAVIGIFDKKNFIYLVSDMESKQLDYIKFIAEELYKSLKA
ncbi:MAG: TetR/AcrR family transcriptional regulator [bacterium]|nr:TetR/AcrR family transcriptional regulator [bacterium]